MNLKKAREQGALNEFAKAHDADAPGDEAAINRALASMARTTKAVREASKLERQGG